MQINTAYANAYEPSFSQANSRKTELEATDSSSGTPELRKAFDHFVGETFFSQLLGQMRKMADKPAYFHGGRAEEVFQGQMDQLLSERLTEASGSTFTGLMFDLFMLGRQ